MNPTLCIYCQKRAAVTDPKKSKGTEHAFARSLGGNLRVSSVCQECNNSFSSIDEALAQHSVVSFMRACETDPSSFCTKIGHEHFLYNPEHNIWLEVSVENEFQPKIIPQIHLMPRGPSEPIKTRHIAASREDHNRLVSSINKVVDEGALHKIHLKIDTDGNCSTPRLVLYRQDALFLRATSVEAANEMLSVIKENWANLRERAKKEFNEQNGTFQAIQNPTVSISLTIKPNDINRAIAKNAFNILAHERGADFAHRSEFNPIRKYIMGEELSSNKPNDDGKFSIDRRFVLGDAFSQTPLVSTSMHFIVVVYYKERQEIIASIILYQQQQYVIKLATISLETEFAFAYEFSYDRSEYRKLSSLELVERLKEINRQRERL